MLILRVLQRNLCVFLKRGELICVLKHQMHQPLHIDLYLDLVLLFQVLVLPLLVPQLSLFVLQLLLAHHPEITDPNPLIIIHIRQLIFMLYLTLQFTTLHPNTFLKVLIHNIVDSHRHS